MKNLEHLVSYSGLHKVDANVLRPKNVDELKSFLAELNRTKQRVTFRCGGYSFHSQSINETVIDLSELGDIALDVKNKRVTVGPGASWETITNITLSEGLVPPILVTVCKAKAGGTISANCFSRSSIRYGRDGNNVSSFKLLTVEGDIKNCSPDENEELYYAAIGGFGYLGAITEITYNNLLDIGEKQRVETIVNKRLSPDAIVEQLEKNKGKKEWQSVYALLFVSDKGEKRGLVFKSRNVEDPITEYDFGDYNGRSFNSMFGLFSLNYPINKAYNWVFDEIPDGFRSVDDFGNYTFFMDGHRKFKETVNQLGFNVITIQQTYLIPQNRVVNFLSHLFELIELKEILPSFFDVVPIPADKFTLSSSRGIDGFAVSIAFDRIFKGDKEKMIGFQDMSDSDLMTIDSIPEFSKADEIQEICQQLANISLECQNLGGRVHLIKNVYVPRAGWLRQMYHPQMEVFLELKRKYDRNNILRNDFFDTVFS